jgi:transposase
MTSWPVTLCEASARGTWKRRNTKTVFAMVERDGRVRAPVVPEQMPHHPPPRDRRVRPAGVHRLHLRLSPDVGIDGRSYANRRIRHSEKVYVSGDVHTQPIEDFFSSLKRGIAGTYHAVSSEWLTAYLNDTHGARTTPTTAPSSGRG